jgi:glucose-6-phosphate dehydrogenase assembly protein OpcA
MEETLKGPCSAGRVLAQVDAELRAFWSTPPSAGELPKARACTMNLVVVAGTPALAAQWVPVVDEVIASVPARAIVVGLDPGGADDLVASVSAVCTPGSASGRVCSERVTLLASGACCNHLPSCIDALRATDVPMTLVWLPSPVQVGDPVFASMASDASRIVLDSATASLASLGHVARWAAEVTAGPRPGVADLTWTRLAPWQELCARMFDEPRLHALARQMTEVRIAQACRGGALLGPEGALLLGWLATRLDWKASSLAGKLAFVRPDGGHVQSQLHAEAAAWAPMGTLLSIELAAQHGSLSVRGRVERKRDAAANGATWRLEVTAGHETKRLEQGAVLRSSEPAPLLERTLHRPPGDHALAEAVAWVDGLRSGELACA